MPVFIIFTNPSDRAGYDTGSIFKRSLTSLNSEFSFSYTRCLTKAEEPSLPYYLLIAGGRIIGFIPFPMVLVLCEMQSVLSRIWTRVAVSISYHDIHYTASTSLMPVFIKNFFTSMLFLIYAKGQLKLQHFCRIACFGTKVKLCQVFLKNKE